MTSIVHAIAAGALGLVRRVPVAHALIHKAALRLETHPVGARFIRGVLDEGPGETIGYSGWVRRYDTLRSKDRRAIAAHIRRFRTTPTISVVVPVYAAKTDLLAEAIDSVRAQLYPHWELCIADDASPGEETWAALTRYAQADPRIRIVRREVNGNICAATNSALALATGEFVALMDHDDLLPARALYEVAALLQDHPDTDLIYSDEDKIDDRGHRYEPHIKTDWNPELMLGQNMVSHLGVYRRLLIEAVGGLREGFEGSQDYDLALRVSDLTTPERIRHIPWILYHWRQLGGPATFSQAQMDRCADAAQRAVASTWPAPASPFWTSAAWPTRRAGSRCAGRRRPGRGSRSSCPPATAPTSWPSAPRGAVADRLRAAGTADCGQRQRRARNRRPIRASSPGPARAILDAPGPFNFSALNNRAAAEARGEILLLLNNDISMVHPDWLDALVAQAVRPNVGAVGARLLFPDGTIQHAGVAVGLGGVAGHVAAGQPGDDAGYFGT